MPLFIVHGMYCNSDFVFVPISSPPNSLLFPCTNTLPHCTTLREISFSSSHRSSFVPLPMDIHFCMRMTADFGGGGDRICRSDNKYGSQRRQREKDTHDVFSDHVDPYEVPNYTDVVGILLINIKKVGPPLILVEVLMMRSVVEIDWNDMKQTEIAYDLITRSEPMAESRTKFLDHINHSQEGVKWESLLQHSRMLGESGGISTVIGALLIIGRKNYSPVKEFAIARITEVWIGLFCMGGLEVVH
ncbi:hypothetical protein L2E82_28557 [Cichorium intybus]|uniref:Uncharacterized protein n=1 Tax=Cichorium intybus TaxID=13427 RepID=A0ACB9CWG4_CICIN|nr:hypothetical protein L2E82_28557 [Cichorium intybus]